MPHLEQQDDGFILGSGDISKSNVYDLSFKAQIKGVTAIRLQLPAASEPAKRRTWPNKLRRTTGGFFLSELKAFQKGQPIKITRAEATNNREEDRISDAAAANPKAKAKAARKTPEETNNASAALDLEMSSGWQVLGGYGAQHAAVFYFEQPMDLTNGLLI